MHLCKFHLNSHYAGNNPCHHGDDCNFDHASFVGTVTIGRPKALFLTKDENGEDVPFVYNYFNNAGSTNPIPPKAAETKPLHVKNVETNQSNSKKFQSNSFRGLDEHELKNIFAEAATLPTESTVKKLYGLQKRAMEWIAILQVQINKLASAETSAKLTLNRISNSFDAITAEDDAVDEENAED